MCSIIGGYNINHINTDYKDFINNSFELMRHRGPDYENITRINSYLTFGHQRLSIIDLSSKSNQPIINKNSFLTYNGEIFNYKNLFKNYFKKSAKSISDSLLLSKLLQKEGIGCLNELNGMFAFAYYNGDELFLVRDRFGIKPLYYTVVEDIVFFSSEFKCLIEQIRQITLDINFEKEYLKYTATDFNENTPIKEIKQVPAGHYLKISNKKIEKIKWYQFSDSIYNKKFFFKKNKKEILDEFENLLIDSIKLRLLSDVPICMTLSGGIDSSLIYTLIKERLNKEIKVFSFVHPTKETDESEIVKLLTKEYKDDIQFISQKNKFELDEIYDLNRILDYPSWGFDGLAFNQVYKAIKKQGYTVVIEGHGADEMFGGYPYMIEPLIIKYLFKFKLKSFFKILNDYNETFEKSQQNKTFVYTIIKLILKRIIKPESRNFRKNIEFSFEHTILPIVLRTFDRITMKNSIENRCPYLDFRIVEFSRNMPDYFVYNSIGTKSILRMILKKYNKEFVYKIKRKLGFSIDIKSFIINSNNSNKLNQFLESERLNSVNPYESIKKLNLKILKEIYGK